MLYYMQHEDDPGNITEVEEDSFFEYWQQLGWGLIDADEETLMAARRERIQNSITWDYLPRKVDIQIVRGNTFRRQVQLLDAFGQPMNLTGVDLKSEVRTATGLAATITVALVTPLTGLVQLSLTAVQTANMPDLAAWDLEGVALNGDILTHMGGDFITKPQVTQ